MEYGKFKTAEELLKGYNELEREFTHKCQQVSNLDKLCKTLQEKQSDGTSVGTPPSDDAPDRPTGEGIPDVAVPEDNSDNGDASSKPFDETMLQQYLVANPEICEQVLKQVYSNADHLPLIMAGGGNVSMAMPSRPKTLKEASEMAQKYFK